MSRLQGTPQLPKASKEVQISWIRHRTITRIVDIAFTTARTVVRAAAVVLVAYFLFAAAREFAGKDTKLSAVLSTAFKMSIDRYAAYLASALFGVSWWRERKLRRKVIADHGPYMRELEETVDPGRTGSRLMADGRTHRRDKR